MTIFRRAKIVATVGPASRSEAILEALLRAGVDVVRLNFSHGTHEEHAEAIRLTRQIATRLDRPVTLLQDLQGPKIRIGALAGGGPVFLKNGDRVTITIRPVAGTAQLLSTNYEALPRDVRPGSRILLADGRIELRVRSTSAEEVQAVVVHGGLLREHQGINLPGVKVSAPSLTQKDLADLAFGISQGVDYVALSFVRQPRDVEEARRQVRKLGADVPIVAKLEKDEAIQHLDAILDVSDAVMVARGDLGVELPLERVPALQKTIIRKANQRGIPVITATQMMESMMASPSPTRAEATDVANAVWDGSDALMLSGETAVGQFPVEAVRMMSRLITEAELQPYYIRASPPGARSTEDRDADHRRVSTAPFGEQGVRHSSPEAIAHAARGLAEDLNVRAIVGFTRTGRTAHLLSRQRPRVPIFAFTPDELVHRRLPLWWGVYSLLAEPQEDIDALISYMDRVLMDRHLLLRGDSVVLVGSHPFKLGVHTNFVKVHRVGEQG